MSGMKPVGPQMGAGFHINQLHVYAGSFCASPHTAVDHVAYIKLHAQLSHIYRTVSNVPADLPAMTTVGDQLDRSVESSSVMTLAR